MHLARAMAAAFPAWANSIYRWALAALALVALIGVPLALLGWARTPYATGEADVPAQPIGFDHRHHVRDDGIDCAYCHAGAWTSPFAGVPATSVCMGCHEQIWSQSPQLAALRSAWIEARPIRWARVTSLPQHVYFHHAIHVAKGVGCATCHGRVDLMSRVHMTEEMTMSFCLGCHRDPGPRLRPPEQVTNMEWTRTPADPPPADVHPTTDCSGCHR